MVSSDAHDSAFEQFQQLNKQPVRVLPWPMEQVTQNCWEKTLF
jgi:hypothetical protein